MKKATLAIVAWAWAVLGFSQCGPCAIGDTCTVDPPFPTVCPSVTPLGVVGVPYGLDATFWVPTSFPEPTTQLNVVLQQVTLVSMENVPMGLTYEANSPSLVYYPQTNQFGCVRICGIPMAAIEDSIRIVVQAQGTAGGLPVNTSYTIPIPITILPASQDTVPDFLSAPDSLCAPATIAFTPAQAAQGMTSAFTWTFGNGSTFAGSTPPEQLYFEGGEYPVTLESTFSTPMLTQLSITGVNNSWCGDLDEPNLPLVGCLGQPDLYFTITDSRYVLTRSAVVPNAQNASWATLSIPMGFPPFTLRVYDKDDLSADDLLGTFSITNTTGAQSFSQSGTAGSFNVVLQTVLTRTFSDTVVVFGAPDLAFQVDLETGTLCAAPDGLSEYQWSFNGEPLVGLNGPCVPAANGLWSVTALSAQGCVGTATTLVNAVGLDETGGGTLAWRLAPNPTVNDLVVLTDELLISDAAISILDPCGRRVRSVPVSGGGGPVLRVDVSGLGDGQYLLRIEQGGVTSSRPFMVLRN